VLRFVPADRPKSNRRADVPGIVTLSLAMLLLVVPLVLGREAGWPVWTWVSLVASVLVLAVFVQVERRQSAGGGYPLVTISLLARRPVALALLSQAMTVACYFALLFTLALFLQQALGRSPLISGLSLVSWVAAFGVAGPVLSRASQRTRQLAAPLGRVVLAAAFGCIATAMALGFADSELLLVVLLGIGGRGDGTAFSGTRTHLASTVPQQYAADLSGMFNTTLQVGGTLGVAVFGTLYLDLAPQAGHDLGVHAFTVVTAVLAATVIVAALLAALALQGRAAGRDSAVAQQPVPQGAGD